MPNFNLYLKSKKKVVSGEYLKVGEVLSLSDILCEGKEREFYDNKAM